MTVSPRIVPLVIVPLLTACGGGSPVPEREEIAGSFIRQWKLNKALYEQYGGRIIFQQGGPEPLDAYRRFLEDSRAPGDFTIATAPLETELWRQYCDDSIHSFYPPGSPEEKEVFAAPPWAS